MAIFGRGVCTFRIQDAIRSFLLNLSLSREPRHEVSIKDCCHTSHLPPIAAAPAAHCPPTRLAVHCPPACTPTHPPPPGARPLPIPSPPPAVPARHARRCLLPTHPASHLPPLVPARRRAVPPSRHLIAAACRSCRPPACPLPASCLLCLLPPVSLGGHGRAGGASGGKQGGGAEAAAGGQRNKRRR